jgi:hypothetical protein
MPGKKLIGDDLKAEVDRKNDVGPAHGALFDVARTRTATCVPHADFRRDPFSFEFSNSVFEMAPT